MSDENAANGPSAQNGAEGSAKPSSQVVIKPASAEHVVNGRWRLSRQIGSGSFGNIFLACDLETNEEVAVKMESAQAKVPQLQQESRIYTLIGDVQGFPNIKWYGQEDGFNIMVMDLLGPSLEDLFDFCSRKFSYKTVLMIADQLVTCLEYLHTKSYFHRDIKPENFLMGLGDSAGQVHLIDMGLAKMYRDAKTGAHIKTRPGKKDLVGTARYASINAHNGTELSRRDDMESLGYVLMYFLRGSLPWQGLKGANVMDKYEKIGEKKRTTSVEELCKGHPPAFAKYLTYCQALQLEAQPDYDFLRGIFRQTFHDLGYHYNYVYDWTILSSKGRLSVSVVQATNLTGKDGSGSGMSDPFCVCQLGQQKHRTRIVSKSINPTWEDHFDFDVTEPSAVLTVNVWHKGRIKDKFLGRVSLPIQTLEHKVMQEEWFELQKRSPKSNISGSIRLVLYNVHGRT